jgi:oligoendopeptidase F
MEHSRELVEWDLSDLYQGPEDPRVASDREWCIENAEAFRQSFSGRVAQLSPDELHSALSILEKIEETGRRIASFAYLSFVTRTHDPVAGGFWQSAQELETQIERKTLFFGLEWSRLSHPQAQSMAEGLPRPYRRHLERIRSYAPHRLSEPEEQVMEALSLSGQKAWINLFDKLMGQVVVGPENRPLSMALSDLYHPARETREKSAMEITAGLERLLPLTTHIHNALALDKSLRDDLRAFPNWLRDLNLRNEVTDEQVALLVQSVTSRYDIVQAYYDLKRSLLQVPKLQDYDRYAPIPGPVQKEVTWEEAKARVMAAYETFSPEAARVAGLFFERKWIHASPVHGKPGGAFSHPTVPSCHPYISMNFTGTQRDVMTLAHELGHGIHQYLYKEQGLYGSSVPLTMAETASIFSEMLVFEDLLRDAASPAEGLAMLCSKLEDLFSTTFRQISMNRFEEAVHRERRKAGELSSERLSSLWMTTQQEMFGESLEMGEHYRIWWSYIPHFVHTPGYVYAYAFAELLALSLLQQYRRLGAEYGPLYLELLRAGSTAAPRDLVLPMGIDISEPSFYERGLGILDDLVKEARRSGGRAL